MLNAIDAVIGCQEYNRARPNSVVDKLCCEGFETALKKNISYVLETFHSVNFIQRKDVLAGQLSLENRCCSSLQCNPGLCVCDLIKWVTVTIPNVRY